MHGIELFSRDRVLNTQYFYGKRSSRKYAPKASLGPILNFGK